MNKRSHAVCIRSAADTITAGRIALSIALIFVPAFSLAFYVVYLLAGLSDMADGAVARRTGTATEFGAKLDAMADLLFAAVVLIKILSVINPPLWLLIWIAAIALVKLANILYGLMRQRKLIAVHSVPNKITGILLFILPLTLGRLEIRYSGAACCIAATAAAVSEGFRVVRACR